jgi:uroporphyrinogen decarboxylase
MNKKERVDAALRGEPVDRVPVSVWGHDYEHEWDVHPLMETLVEDFTRYDWDFMKVQSRSTYFAEVWKARYRPSGEKTSKPIFEYSPIRSSTDWKRLRPREPDQGPFGDQLRLMQLLNHQVGYDAYFMQTIFCPLGVALSLVGNDPEPVLLSIREDRSALHSALRIITETLANYAIACLEMGTTGIFYTTNGWASESLLSLDQYREFGEQYDLEFLDAIKSRSKLTVLHNSGERIHFDLLASYPSHAHCWDVYAPGNPDLREGQRRSGKAVVAGLNRTTLCEGSPGQVQDEVGQALETTGARSLLLAPGGTLSPSTPTRNLEAIRRALS